MSFIRAALRKNDDECVLRPHRAQEQENESSLRSSVPVDRQGPDCEGKTELVAGCEKLTEANVLFGTINLGQNGVPCDRDPEHPQSSESPKSVVDSDTKPMQQRETVAKLKNQLTCLRKTLKVLQTQASGDVGRIRQLEDVIAEQQQALVTSLERTRLAQGEAEKQLEFCKRVRSERDQANRKLCDVEPQLRDVREQLRQSIAENKLLKAQYAELEVLHENLKNEYSALESDAIEATEEGERTIAALHQRLADLSNPPSSAPDPMARQQLAAQVGDL